VPAGGRRGGGVRDAACPSSTKEGGGRGGVSRKVQQRLVLFLVPRGRPARAPARHPRAQRGAGSKREQGLHQPHQDLCCQDAFVFGGVRGWGRMHACISGRTRCCLFLRHFSMLCRSSRLRFSLSWRRSVCSALPNFFASRCLRRISCAAKNRTKHIFSSGSNEPISDESGQMEEGGGFECGYQQSSKSSCKREGGGGAAQPAPQPWRPAGAAPSSRAACGRPS